MQLLLLSLFSSVFTITIGSPIAIAQSNLDLDSVATDFTSPQSVAADYETYPQTDIAESVDYQEFPSSNSPELIASGNVDQLNLDDQSDPTSVAIANENRIATQPESASLIAQKPQANDCLKKNKKFQLSCLIGAITSDKNIIAVVKDLLLPSALVGLVTKIAHLKRGKPHPEAPTKDADPDWEKWSKEVQEEIAKLPKQELVDGNSAAEQQEGQDDTQDAHFEKFFQSVDQNALHATVEDSIRTRNPGADPATVMKGAGAIIILLETFWPVIFLA